MEQQIEKMFFVSEIIASKLAAIFSIKKRILVIASE